MCAGAYAHVQVHAQMYVHVRARKAHTCVIHLRKTLVAKYTHKGADPIAIRTRDFIVVGMYFPSTARVT